MNKLGLLGSWAAEGGGGGREKDKNKEFLEKYPKNDKNHYNFYMPY